MNERETGYSPPPNRDAGTWKMNVREILDLDNTPLILVIDDAKEAAESVSNMLRASDFRTILAESSESGLSIAERYAPAAILISSDLESSRGYETCTQIKGRLATADTPVIMLADDVDRDDVVELCFRSGAHDLVARPIRSSLLMARLRVALRESRLREEYKRLATQDSTTGLDNRRQFFMHVSETVATCQRFDRESYLVICDIDGLASINAQYGYDLGDEVIIMLARLTKRLISVDCRVGRIAGDAIAILLKKCDEARATATVERVRRTFEAIAFDADSSPKHFTLSCGVSRCRKQATGYTPDQMMSEADTALFVAKHQGGHQIRHHWTIEQNTLDEIGHARRHARKQARHRTERGFVGGKSESSTPSTST